MDLGPAVTFLMSALNLRLGLWVPHPKNGFRGYYQFPGRFFLLELLGRSQANARNLLLSDGNHFENFGLYELIRRHVRYIIVSDCGADPEVAFDDLANVLRRVREDFGVEIELDVSALRPGDSRLSNQHAVVGTIHYNGIIGMDKGTIIFFKPTLTAMNLRISCRTARATVPSPMSLRAINSTTNRSGNRIAGLANMLLEAFSDSLINPVRKLGIRWTSFFAMRGRIGLLRRLAIKKLFSK